MTSFHTYGPGTSTNIFVGQYDWANMVHKTACATQRPLGMPLHVVAGRQQDAAPWRWMWLQSCVSRLWFRWRLRWQWRWLRYWLLLRYWRPREKGRT